MEKQPGSERRGTAGVGNEEIPSISKHIQSSNFSESYIDAETSNQGMMLVEYDGRHTRAEWQQERKANKGLSPIHQEDCINRFQSN